MPPVPPLESALLDEAARQLQAGREVLLRVSGQSMFPFLREGRHRVRLSPRPPLRPGRILFYKDRDRYLLHRLCKVQDGLLLIRGDGRRGPYERIAPDRVYGYASRILGPGEKETDPYTRGRLALSWLWRKLFFLRRPLLFICLRFAGL